MKTLTTIAFCILHSVASARAAHADSPTNGLTEAEQRGGWQLLFDGKTTAGWRNYKQTAIGDGWQVVDGELRRVKKNAGDIVSDKQYEYFELSLEYNISKGGNSGLMFLVTEDAARPWHSGPEIQIQDNIDGHDPQKSGWLYQLYEPVKPAWAIRVEDQGGIVSPAISDATRPPGQWNNIYLRILPTQCEVAINGVSYYYFQIGTEDWDERVAKSKFAKFANFGKATRGHLCLQDHGNDVAFRNIKIRELPADGSVPDPVDGTLALRGVPAFPQLKWDGWESIDERGKIRSLRPMGLTHAGDGSNRIVVPTQRGQIHIFQNDPGTRRTHLFLDITEKVHDWAEDNEEGLLGLAMHPQYKKNGHFYLYYSSAAEPRTSILSRFNVSKDDPNRADPASEQVVIKIPQPFSNHNGGSIAFGKDGYLYIALGDGGGRNDPLAHGQNLKTWMGSVLRIDVDRRDAGRNYAIPLDNPFVDRPLARPEIFAYGFRNVWRLSVDRQTGTVWVGDVGQDLWEEIDIVRRGGNYGWSIRESTHAFNNGQTSNPEKPIDPVWEYDHQVGKSITGGLVYRGSRLPELQGKYLYADFVSGKIWALQYDEAARRVVKNYRIASTGIPVLSFGEDEQGEVYYTIQAADGQGIYRFDRTE
ncbi:MAG: PQQ-dependent sugar dehydrogenase [Pirellulaceae bacterium]|jgi:glucose/arabinose dehydrogenase|nr:PQQ-dependent sugar dehydrogenase [Pirellulaceae bacterium]